MHRHNFQYSSSPGTPWLMILILHHMRHQAPGPLLSPRRSHPKLNIMTKWLNAPPLWNVFITITTPSPVPSPSQVWIFKQHLIPSSPPPHLTLSTLSSQPRSVKGVPLSKFDSSHSSTIYWPGLILLNIVTISTWWILSPCTFDVRFRAVNKSLRSLPTSTFNLRHYNNLCYPTQPLSRRPNLTSTYCRGLMPV